VDLKYSLRQIQTNRVTVAKFRIDLPMDGFPSDGGFDNDHLGTLMPFGAPSTPSFHRHRELLAYILRGPERVKRGLTER
jgi:hypothetical protein